MKPSFFQVNHVKLWGIVGGKDGNILFWGGRMQRPGDGRSFSNEIFASFCDRKPSNRS